MSISIADLPVLKKAISRSDSLLGRFRLLRRDMKSRLDRGAYQKMLNYELTLEKYQQQDLVDALNALHWSDSLPSALEAYCLQLDPEAKHLYPLLVRGLEKTTPSKNPPPE